MNEYGLNLSDDLGQQALKSAKSALTFCNFNYFSQSNDS